MFKDKKLNLTKAKIVAKWASQEMELAEFTIRDCGSHNGNELVKKVCIEHVEECKMKAIKYLREAILHIETSSLIDEP